MFGRAKVMVIGDGRARRLEKKTRDVGRGWKGSTIDERKSGNMFRE